MGQHATAWGTTAWGSFLDEFGGCIGSTALAGGLIENDGSGGRDVQRGDTAGHGNAEKVVAGAADKIVQARALASEDDHEIAGEVELVVVGRASFVETDDPEVVALEILEGADEVDDAGDAKVLGCAGAGLHGRRAEGRGAALGEDDTVDTGAVGDAEQRAEVLRIFNAVEREDEAGGGLGGIGFEEILDGEEFLRADEGHDALVRGRFGDEGELLSGLLPDADSGLAALCDEALQAIVLALACDEDVVKAAASGFESFLDRMQAVENFHEISLVSASAMNKARRWSERFD